MRNTFIVMNLIWIFSSLASCARPQVPRTDPAALRPGDLIFLRLGCGDLCEAIHRATRVPGLPAVSHVAVVERVDGRRVTLIEAYDRGVARVELETLTARSRHAWYAARLKSPHDAIVPFFLEELRARLGKPYDPLFLPDNDAYYCSELVSDALLSLGVRVFPRIPMSFGKPGSWEYGVWEKYYHAKNMDVPQGHPGTNPNQLLASPHIERLTGPSPKR